MEYNIEYFNRLESTNDKAKEIGSKKEEGTVIIAKEQTKGRGRLGRRWYSSGKKSITMSIILKPKMKAEDIQKITLIASVAINLALKDIDIDSKIKWPNDIVIDNKKVCGILTELSTNFTGVNYVVVGIGINVNQVKVDIPKEIFKETTSLRLIKNKEINKNEIINNVLNKFKELYIQFNSNGHIDEIINIYRKNSIIIGKEILIIQGNNKRKGKALDIDNQGELLVEFPEGIENISSGEISIRGLEGYID